MMTINPQVINHHPDH